MSIRVGFLLLASTLSALLASILYVMSLLVANERELEAREARHYDSYKLADELRRSSDDLTRMARTYVVTGDPRYETWFRRILAIRNGESPRPAEYGSAYWDAVSASGEEPPATGETVSLETLMRRLVENRIKPYYLHHTDRANGTAHFRCSVAQGQELAGSLRGRVSGVCQPTYVLDIPGGHGKSPAGQNFVRARDDGDIDVMDYTGNWHRYES